MLLQLTIGGNIEYNPPYLTEVNLWILKQSHQLIVNGQR